MAWCGMVCRDVVERFGAKWRQCMWNVVRCWMLQFQTWCDWLKCKMSHVWTMACGMWCSGMWKGCHNARCGKSVTMCRKCQWWCGIVVICNVLCDCSVMSYVENDVMCCDVRCGGVIRYGIWCGVMRCGIWCGVKYAMLNVGVVWNSCGYGMAARVRCGLSVWCGTACASVEMWWCEMVVSRQTAV